jgi:UDP-N-acetylmuramyl pentapeptide phosphotransferase/UDP-N-acetylglucosamine-1-phosphate transferase
MIGWSLAPLLVGLVAAVAAWLVALLVGEWARRRQILDLPNERSSHVRPTPRLGGIGLVCGVVAGCLLPMGAGTSDPGRLGLVLAIASGLAAVSLLDDLRGLSAQVRLVLHAAAGALTVWGLDVVPRALAAGASEPLALAFGALAAIWIVAFVNAFNFMDGIDGIAAGQALVAGVGWLVVAAVVGDAVVIRLAAAVAGASAGFLILNWSPARLFMGDVGSAFLGYLLAAVPLAGGDPVGLAAPALLLVWPFLFDTAFTLVRRARRGERLLDAHRSHLYQRLSAPALPGALTHAQVSGRYMALAAVGAASAWALATARWLPAALGVLVAGGLAVLLWRAVIRVEATAGQAPR